MIDRIYCQDSRNMNQIPDSTVHLIITSPPYNVGKEYDRANLIHLAREWLGVGNHDQNLSFIEYRKLLKDIFSETYRVLVEGGRICINIANLGRKPYLPLHSYIIQDLLDIGFLMRGEIIWDKSASAGVSTAWGSFQSASNPTLRDVHEYILIFSKGNFAREKGDTGGDTTASAASRALSSLRKRDTISKEQFLQYTKSIWQFQTESSKKIQHPTPFPLELPFRLIQLYSFECDIVLDPFCGSGTTCVAAKKSNRHYIGYDVIPEYCQIARERLSQEFASENEKCLC